MKGFTVAASLAAGVVAFAANSVRAVPVEIDVPNIRAIQLNSLDEKGEDQVYLLADGVTGGKELQEKLPAEGTLPCAPKKLAVSEKAPLLVWKGDLDNGQYAFLTVTLFQGNAKDEAKLKEFQSSVVDAQKKTAELAKPTITADDAKKLAAAALKNEQPIIVKIKDTFSREKKTDHFGGQFNLLVWNDGGKIMKRLDPIGLTFGEHFGTDLKIYSKLKATRSNVLVEDGGQWTQQQLLPLDDEEKTVRVKMLETESMPTDKGPTKHVTDYLVEVQVKDQTSKPLHWTLEGENTGYDVVHTYYDFAD